MEDQAFEKITPLPEGGPWEFVSVSNELAVPRRFLAELPAGTTFEIEVNDLGQGRLVSMLVRAPEGGRLTGEDLRRIPVGRLTRQAVAGAAKPVAAGKVRGLTLLEAILTRSRAQREEDAAFYRRYTDSPRHPRQGSPLTDENLQEVANVYRAAIDRGDPPTQTVADSMHVARSTAARWVATARRRSFLGPALRGQGGEAEVSQP